MRRNRVRIYRWLIVLQVALLVLAGAPAAAAPLPQSSPVSGGEASYEYAACSRVADKNALRTEIAQLILTALENPVEPLDVDAIVAAQWARLGVDAVIDSEVDRVVDHLLETEPWHLKAASAWGPPVAEGYAKLVAKRAFASEVFTTTMEGLSRAVAEDISLALTAEFERAASAGLQCLEEFAGAKYGSALYVKALENVVSDSAPDSDDPGPFLPPLTGPVDPPTLVALLISILLPRLTREIGETVVGRIAGKIVERVLGKGASSLVPIAGWVIGIGMLAYDLWESGKGALPQIREAMKSAEAKAQIRLEVTQAVKESLPEQVDVVAYQIAATLVDEWDHFCAAYGDICQLQDENPTFAELVKETKLEELDTIRKLLSVYQEKLGQQELMTAIASGGFGKILASVLDLEKSQPEVQIPGANDKSPLEHVLIIRLLLDTHSTEDALAWAKLAGDQPDRLVIYGIHLSTTPETWTPDQLTLILALPKGNDIEKVLTLTADQRDILLSLPEDQVMALLEVCQPELLAVLTGQMLLPGSPPEAIAQGALDDCRWEEKVAIVPPTATFALTPTPTHIAPVITPAPPSSPQFPTLPPLDPRWSIIAFLSICILLEVGYIGWMFMGSVRRKKHTKPEDDPHSEEPR